VLSTRALVSAICSLPLFGRVGSILFYFCHPKQNYIPTFSSNYVFRNFVLPSYFCHRLQKYISIASNFEFVPSLKCHTSQYRIIGHS
jgi:hypothetical protein